MAITSRVECPDASYNLAEWVEAYTDEFRQFDGQFTETPVTARDP